MKGKANKALGAWGEEVACTFFKERGYDILHRNYRVPVGEVDLICQKGDVIVFVEVKVRRSSNFGGPEEAITPFKMERMIKAAKWYIMEHSVDDEELRFDCICISGTRDGYSLEHIESAFET